MSTYPHPEQILGNLFQFIIELRSKGIKTTRRSQALGSAAVDTLRRDGWVLVRYDALDKAQKLGRLQALQELQLLALLEEQEQLENRDG